MNQFLEYARKILDNSEEPLTYKDIWEKGKDLGFDKDIFTKGKTPWQTLGAQLYVDVRDNPNSIFIKVGKDPAKFFLRSKASILSGKEPENLDSGAAIPKIKEKEGFTERDLHPLLAYFAYTNLQFSRGKAILTKTIYHEASKKNGLSEWIHPDMVGVYIPIDDWNSEIIELNNISNSNSITLYSFELKKSIDRSNYREYFFQAVSNSSWANEGYLVTGNIRDDDELLNELERLSTSFGIGIIELDLEDIYSSRVIFQAHRKKELDWETMNKLTDINKDFRKFIQDVKIDFDSKRIHKSEYDEIISNPEEYIKKIMKKVS